MDRRILSPLLAWTAALALSGCGDDRSAEDAQVDAAAPRAIAGRYEVTGVTVNQESGEQRAITGVVTLAQEGARYTTHFELSTVFPGSDAAAAEVVGTGEGSIEANMLYGSAQTQLVVSNVSGVDVGFAYIPRAVGTRLASKSTAEFFDDGTMRIEIENEPGEGEDYSPTRTTLVGYPAPAR